MRALTYKRYGPAEVVEVREVPEPLPGPEDVLVHVHASAVNSADWRVRAAAFPGLLAIPGRMMFGLLKPRNERLGTEFAGTVKAVGYSVSRFSVGDRVYGFLSGGGASADYLCIHEDAAVVPLPASLSFEEGAALPFGGLAALVFLTQFGDLKFGQNSLIVGASGGVGAYAVQIAKSVGASVSGIAGPDSQDLIRKLGVDHAIDYTTTDITKLTDRFDLILDTVGALTPGEAFALLKSGGVYLPLNMGLREVMAAMLNCFRDRKIKLGVNEDTAEDLAALNALVETGQLKAVIDSVYPLEEAVVAHQRVEGRHKKGAVVLQL